MKAIKNIKELRFPWVTQDPFLFCAHHRDIYPKGNDELGPQASLQGRNIGNDFTIKDGFRMYHGDKVPGFPVHPHRGFETVTFVTQGLVDHSDSHGGAGRYGNRDVQWMTAGSGLQHSEMFPLLNKEDKNPFELFQIWLNLPRANKFVKPAYKMLWGETIPQIAFKDKNQKQIKIDLVAGSIENNVVPGPAPDSWAANPEHEVGIWQIDLEAGANWNIPPASKEVNRSLYFFKGESIDLNGEEIGVNHAIELFAHKPVLVQNGQEPSRMLILQGKPIGEPIVQYGPFVMNTMEEIEQAFSDYRQTQFGGWPWPRQDMIHGKEKKRFARYGDGTETIKD